MTLVVLDTNLYLRLAKRVRPFLGVPFGAKQYVLVILPDVEEEVRRSARLKFLFPWFDGSEHDGERKAKALRLSVAERQELDAMTTILRQSVLEDAQTFTNEGRTPPSETDCRVLALASLRDGIAGTDDMGMHLLAGKFDITVWHGWELLKRMKSGKMIDNPLIRDIFDALERNNDLPRSWRDAKETHLKGIFGSSG